MEIAGLAVFFRLGRHLTHIVLVIEFVMLTFVFGPANNFSGSLLL